MRLNVEQAAEVVKVFNEVLKVTSKIQQEFSTYSDEKSLLDKASIFRKEYHNNPKVLYFIDIFEEKMLKTIKTINKKGSGPLTFLAPNSANKKKDKEIEDFPDLVKFIIEHKLAKETKEVILLNAIERGRIDLIRNLIELKVNLNISLNYQFPQRRRETFPLYHTLWCACEGNLLTREQCIIILQLLLEKGANINQQKNSDKENCLGYLTRRTCQNTDFFPIFEAFLAQGPNCNLKSADFTPLSWVLHDFSVDMARGIVREIDAYSDIVVLLIKQEKMAYEEFCIRDRIFTILHQYQQCSEPFTFDVIMHARIISQAILEDMAHQASIDIFAAFRCAREPLSHEDKHALVKSIFSPGAKDEVEERLIQQVSQSAWNRVERNFGLGYILANHLRNPAFNNAIGPVHTVIEYCMPLPSLHYHNEFLDDENDYIPQHFIPKYKRLIMSGFVSGSGTTNIQFLITKAEEGDAEAQYKLGKAYLMGNEIFAQNTEKALKYLALAVKQGHKEAQCDLAEYYLIQTIACIDKKQCIEDSKMALELMTLSANQGYARAERLLGSWYAHGELAAPKDTKKAMELWQSAANKGDAKAQKMIEEFLKASVRKGSAVKK